MPIAMCSPWRDVVLSLQSNQICNVFGARTNNRPLQPVNERNIKIAMRAGASSS